MCLAAPKKIIMLLFSFICLWGEIKIITAFYLTIFILLIYLENITIIIKNASQIHINPSGFKIGLSPSKNIFLFASMMKNAFYFILIALFILKIFKFLSWLFGHLGKTTWLRNIKLLSKFHKLFNKLVTIPKLSSISQSKGNQAMKFSVDRIWQEKQFFQKSCRKWAGRLA